MTDDYYLYPPDKRPRVEWPGRMSMRRWAYRAGASGNERDCLYQVYRRELKRRGRTPGDSTWNEGDEEDDGEAGRA